MKVLYLSPYFDAHSGYAKAAQDEILAMDSVDIDVVPRPLIYSQNRCEVPPRILELEQKSMLGTTHCIQYTLPQHMTFNGRLKKNIGRFEVESSNFRSSSWTSHANCMDELWTVHESQEEVLINSGITSTIKTVAHPINTNRFNDLIDTPKNDTFSFYFIGEYSKRKNLEALIRAFHLEFSPQEPVELYIKTHMPGMDVPAMGKFFNDMVAKIKTELKLYVRRDGTPAIDMYKRENFFIHNMSDEEIRKFHTSNHALVCPSYGEGWCLPVVDAMSCGNPVIATGLDTFKNWPICPVMSTTTKVYGMHERTFTDLYTGSQSWEEISLCDLMSNMREVYENSDYRKRLCREGREAVQQYSYTAIGERILKLLED